jgi:phenylacetate-coenzyme A ligase PaaK-like adenylate-forming protein
MPVSDLLYAPREAIDAERSRCFAEMMDLAAERHPHTRRRMAALGIARADLVSLADLPRLPPTLKSEYMADPDAFRLDAEGLPAEMRTVWDVMYTTGTSAGRPTPFVSTTTIFSAFSRRTATCCACAGRGPRTSSPTCSRSPPCRTAPSSAPCTPRQP